MLNTPSTDSRIWAAEVAAEAALADPRCAALFNVGNDPSVPDPQTLLAEMASGLYGRAYMTFSDIGGPQNGTIANAQTSTTSYQAQPGFIVGFSGVSNNAVLTINTNPLAPFNSGTAVYDATTLLHELGHVYEKLFGVGSTFSVDDNTGNKKFDKLAGNFNNQIIQANCFLGG